MHLLLKEYDIQEALKDLLATINEMMKAEMDNHCGKI